MKERICKFLANNGVSSRRFAEKLVTDGKVSVNGIVISSPVYFVDGTENIIVNGKKILIQSNFEIYKFNKPIDVMTTRSDPYKRKTIYDVLPEKYKDLKYIGRLDYKTTGLLLLTNSGEILRKLTLPSSKIKRVYIADVSENNFKGFQSAIKGAIINGIKYRPMKIKEISKNKLSIEIYEGKKNEVRIVLSSCGLIVKNLHRISYGNIYLDNLPVGEIRKLDKKIIDELLTNLM